MTPLFEIRVGNQTAAFAPALMAPFEFAVSHGFKAFEWFPDKTWTESDLDRDTRDAIRRTARDHDIRLSVHAPLGLDPLRPEESVPAEPALALTRDLGAAVFNIHLQTEQGPEAFLEAIEPLIRQTAAMNVVLALENTPLTGPEDFNAFFKVLRAQPKLPNRHVGLCFDLGHANLCAATRNDYLGFLDRLSPEVPVVHLHLHENYGDRDAHLPLFTGPAGENDRGIRGLIERLQAIQFQGSAIMEVWPDPPERLTESRDRLAALIGESHGTDEDSPASPRPSPAASSSDPFAARLIDTDRKARSWREKLQGVEHLLDESADPLPPENLAFLAVYLRWLHTGRIPCREDSRHFRPSHHARTGAAIDDKLRAWKNDDNALILRRIHANLPSYDTPFTRAEPLTRIRDIAHRNDIPKELKNEIKHSLQNKLHRCAGPEDLQTSEKLLARIENGDYPAEFVSEFQTFHRELQTFFNTQSLAERLEPLREELSGDGLAALQRFLEISSRNPQGASGSFKRFHAVTHLRAVLVPEAEKREAHSAQAFRLAEIELEAFAFPALSDLLNGLTSAKRFQWKKALETLSLTLRQMELNGAWTEEIRAIRHEIDSLLPGFRASDPLALARLKASIGRVRRLCDTIADRVIDLFRRAAETIGQALGIPEKDISLFCEAELRRDLVFQLAKLNSLLLREQGNTAGEHSCEPLAPGTARGRLNAVERLEQIKEDCAEATIVLLPKATGDEDIPAPVTGLVVLEPIPLLSHLAVRARQAGIPLVYLESGDETDKLRRAESRRLFLKVNAEGLTWQEDNGDGETAAREVKTTPRSRGTETSLDLSTEPPVLPLGQVTVERTGHKAAALRRLADLADQSKAFTVPPTLVIPFGVLEKALRDHGTDATEGLVNADAEDLGPKLKSLQETISRLPVPREILERAADTFPRDTPLIARSSASAEDGAGGAGAGIYTSVPNLLPDHLANGIRAVWASLWTLKAFHNRRRSGVDPIRCGMAVILQPLITPDLSFILHSIHPVTADPDEVYIEAAPGLGATLADAAEPGTPYRLTVGVGNSNGTSSATVNTLAFCNYSHFLRPGAPGALEKGIADYSDFPFTRDHAFRDNTARRLAAVAKSIESALSSPQDIEGFMVNDQIHLVQTRPQQGLAPD